MHSEKHPRPCGRASQQDLAIHQVGGREPHLLLMMYQIIREGSLVLQGRPLNAVDNALLCMLVCSSGREPVKRSRLPVRKRCHAGIWGGDRVLPDMMSAAASHAECCFTCQYQQPKRQISNAPRTCT